jgi:predicted GH43/DUF377 family glycosyl hydrolase
MELDLKKNLALFPRKSTANMRCFLELMVNNYLMYSDSVTQWDNPFSYRNLVIHGIYSNWKLRISNLDCRRMVSTHGVGAMRRYCIGASLFDLDDPSKEIGRLKEPYFLHEKMNGKDMYPMVLFLRCDYSQQQLNLPMPYPTIPLRRSC